MCEYPVFSEAKVLSCQVVEGARPLGSVYKLTLETQKQGMSGQFFMLRSKKSQNLLARPISIYHSEKIDNGCALVSFLILLKGRGTKELVSLKKDDEVQVLGPLGNGFQAPSKFQVSSKTEKNEGLVCNEDLVCIVGGGIGVAPVAGFAESLEAKSYDFYASFKSGSYGLENVQAKNLIITTDDGSVGISGMLPSALDEKVLEDKKYSAVYACGPTPMLSYIQKICKNTGTKCFLSMENRMACGLGACLGCTIKTTEGNKRCCKDGPVFDGEKLVFVAKSPSATLVMASTTATSIASPIAISATSSATSAVSSATSLTLNSMQRLENRDTVSKPDLSVNIAGIHFENPVIAASGTFGFGSEYETVFDINRLGGICSKGLTLEAKSGNTGLRLAETPSGLINSIGLENPGVEVFIKEKLPLMKKLKPVSIANLGGHSIEGYVEGAKLLDSSDVDMIELNISCPNVKSGGMGFGLDPCMASDVTSKVRSVTKKPLIVKLSPNAPSVVDVASAVIESGADALSLCNTFQATAIDIEKEKFVFDNVTAGLAGPAIKPLALRIVLDVCKAIKQLPQEKQVPVIGLGGVSSWQDAVEFILVGASAIQVGTATFSNPNCMIEIIDGLEKWMAKKGYASINDFCGKLLLV